MDIQSRIESVKCRINEAAMKTGRRPEEIKLLAITKIFPVETILEAYHAGLRDFGENRVQEALGKIGFLPSDICWHLVGQLQTNKINKILGKFILIHSVDSIRLAEALSVRIGSGTQDVLLEVNTSGEENKSGVTPIESVEIAEKICQLTGLKLKGLMTVGPLTEKAQKQRDAFKKLKDLFEEIREKDWAGDHFSVLSMGMSGDFEMAIEEGSTLVRVGTAIFGERH